ncbi:hypothetical protein AAG570_010127 [Ranatra chinensis]|uniref:HMG box domain-containing protein n=1 Tax=Ranatra chinensis TaxID=642074 RepID=A0ABD0YLM1_9HEMI
MALPSSYAKPTTIRQPQLLAAEGPISFGFIKEQIRAKEGPTFVSSSPNGHPGFQPQEVGKGPGNQGPKPPKPPDKPLMPYMRYSRKVWDRVKAQNPELKLWEIGKIIGQMWRDLPDSMKTPFFDEYNVEKVEYEKILKAYHNSPAYQAYMAAKAKGRSATPQPAEKVQDRSQNAGGKQGVRNIFIEPADDDDPNDDVYSVKHLAYARYLRNHRLINEMFSSSVVPMTRSIITSARMEIINRQVNSLTSHQKTMEAELRQMEEKFEAKKRQLAEANEAFERELKKHCRRVVDEETFQKMVERQIEILRKERTKESNGVEEPPMANQHEVKNEKPTAVPVALSASKCETTSEENVQTPTDNMSSSASQ